MIINPNYKKPQQQDYIPISEEELKKTIMEKEFEQKCEWQLRKLGMGDESSNFSQRSSNSVNSNTIVAINQTLLPMNNFGQSNSVNSINAGLSMDFDEFGMMGMRQFQ